MSVSRSGWLLAAALFAGALVAGAVLLDRGGKKEDPEVDSEPVEAPPLVQQEPALPPGTIRVYYDELRAPHIFADTDADVFYGHGYTQMRDFPVATLANLWSTTGRFAEIAGPRVLRRDIRVRMWGIDEVARQQVEDDSRLDPGIRRLLDSYVAGVNAGRAFWRERPQMMQALMGDAKQVWIDPVPPWMNPAYTGYDPLVLFQHMLEAEVQLFHVLTLGVALNAGTEFFGGGYALGTNVWLARNPASDPGMLALMDAHQPINRDGLRSYPVQLHGPRFQMSGIGMPGYPCIFSGFSDELFFGLSTPPKQPGPVLYNKLPFRLSERIPQTTMRWEAELEGDAPPRFVVDGNKLQELEHHQVSLRAFDPKSGKTVKDPKGVRHFYRVPTLKGELAGQGIGHPVTSPTPGQELQPEEGMRIVFEGRSFLSSRNAMETFLNVGYSKRTGGGKKGIDKALGPGRLSFGRAEIFLAGDVEGGMEYVMLTHAPRPGREARKARTWIGDPLLDGHDSGFRWLGFHEFSELAQLSLQPGYLERNDVWLNCNTSPHYIRHPDDEPFAFEGAPWIYDNQAWKTLRHDRARALFDRLGRNKVLSLEDIQRIALDSQDAWAERMWPWIAVMPQDDTLSLNGRDLVDWFEEERFLDANRKPGRDQFLAHKGSRIMPFVTLLMGWFEDRIARLPSPKAHEIAFAYDPSSKLPQPDTFITDPIWERTRNTLRETLGDVGSLWVATRDKTAGGLVTHRYLAPRKACNSVIPDPWRRKPKLDKNPELQWGDVNYYLMTPHVLPKPNIKARESWLISLLEPCSFQHLPPYFKEQQTAVAPVRGTRTSIFHTHSQSLFQTDEKLFPTDEGLVYFIPVDFASQVMIAVELRPEKTARARMLPSMGATEILIDLPENGTKAEDHFAPFANFLRGRWTDFPQNEQALKSANLRWHNIERN